MYKFIIQNIDAASRHTDPNGRYDQNEIKRNKRLNYFNKIALYFGLQYKPSSGAEWKTKHLI